MVKGIIANKEKINYIAFILDKSGSMKSIQSSIMKAFNKNIDTLKAETEGMTTKVCIVVFSTHGKQKEILWLRDIDDVEYLTSYNYNPSGMTAMYDAVGYTLDKLSEDTKNVNGDISYLVTIISDGYENDSKNYRAIDISKMIQERENDGRWTITYIGANQDLSQVSENTGIDRNQTMAFNSTNRGVHLMSEAYSIGTKKYFDGRKKGLSKVSNLYDGSSIVDSD